mgnify:CR=1 FL=1
MKNILIVLPNDNLGGAEQYLKMVAVYFANKGIKVNVFFLKKVEGLGWNDIKSNINVDLHFTNSDSELKGVLPMTFLLLKKKSITFDLIFTSHIHLTGYVGFLIKLSLIKKKKFVGRESTSIFKRYKGRKLLVMKLMYKMGYSSLDLLICQTDYMRKQLLEALPWLSNKTRVKVLPNPVSFSKGLCEEKIDDKYGEFIVSAGRLIQEKGFDILIQAFSLLKQSNPTLKLVILGEGNKREELEGLVGELNLEKSVNLLGFVDNVYPYFKKAKICVVASRIEGFPNVLLQMMSQNTKIVSTKCAGGIENLKGVVTAETDNVLNLKEAIEIGLTQNSTANRELFDINLKERSIVNFIKKVEFYLKN